MAKSIYATSTFLISRSHTLRGNYCRIASFHKIFNLLALLQRIQQTMAQNSKILPNPNCEVLRMEGIKDTTNIYSYLPDLKANTKYIHALWLFDILGTKVLQKLCRSIDGTPHSYLFSGWKDLGYQLGVSGDILRCIQFSKRLPEEGETYCILLAFSQSLDATLEKVVEALEAIGRFDSIEVCHTDIQYLADQIQLKFRNDASNEESGYISMSSDSISSDNRRNIESARSIIKPNKIVPVPLTLRGLDHSDIQHLLPENSIHVTNTCARNVIQESYQNSSPINANRQSEVAQHQKSPSKKIYNCIVMLTFARDGLEYVQEIAAALRQERGSQHIGVLILEEHSDEVNSNPQRFIFECFRQVHYVMPVITKGYLQAIVDTSPLHFSQTDYTDIKYVRYIYKLMNDFYINNGCLNTKIRCIVPDNLAEDIPRLKQMREPVFETWERVSKIDEVGKRMLHAVGNRRTRHL